MRGISLGVIWRLAAMPILVAALGILCYPQTVDGRRSNYPMPLLLTASDDNRALTDSDITSLRVERGRTSDQTGQSFGRPGRAFSRGSGITLLATNIDLMDGEGPSALRIYARD